MLNSNILRKMTGKKNENKVGLFEEKQTEEKETPREIELAEGCKTPKM